VSAPRFILFGAQGEYVLQPLHAALQARGMRSIEIVAAPGRDAVAGIAALGAHDGPTVLVTCAHILHDTVSMAEFLHIPHYPPLLWVIDRLKPALTVYCPHDLGTPFLWDEQTYLHRIDLYLAATAAERALARQTAVEVVGWIKLPTLPKNPERRGRALWLCMSAESLIAQIGAARTLAQYRPHLRPWCAMKLAPYDDCRPLETLFRDAGVPVVDCFAAPVEHVPHYDVVVSNGPSSVVREAAMLGRPVYVLLAENIFPQRYLGDMREFADLPNLHLIRGMDEIPEAPPPSLPNRLLPFDADRAIRAMLARLP